MKLVELAEVLGRSVEGRPATEVRALAGLDDAGPGDLTFVSHAGMHAEFARSRAGAFILPPDLDALDRACIRSPVPYVDFARAIRVLIPAAGPPPGVHSLASVADSAELDEDVSVGAFAVVGEGVRIGARTVVHPHVTIYADCVIGDDCTIHAGARIREHVRLGDRVVIQNGAVVGADGFGFAFREDGSRLRIPHCAGVTVEDDAEIGSNSTIDASHPAHPRGGRATSATWIGPGAKIDNLVQVAHGCEIGERVTLCAQVGLAGRTRLGTGVFFAGKSATSGNLTVGAGASVLGMSGVMSDLEAGAQVVGVPAVPRKLFFRMMAATKRLPDLVRRIGQLEKQVGELRG